VRVHAAALNPKDVLVRKGRMKGFVAKQFPRTPGYDIAGILLDSAGELAAGTEVYGMIQHHRGGACAELVSLPADQIARKPSGLTMVEAAAVPLAALTALQGLRDNLRVNAGDRVLLNGASGGVGTFAVQVAKALGASGLAFCSSRNVDLVRSLGADRVIDYTQDPPSSEKNVNRIFDIYGSFPWPQAKRSLARGGRYCTTIPSIASLGRTLAARVGLHRSSLVIVRSNRSDLDYLSGLINSGQLRPVIDQVFSLEESEKGHEHLETRRTCGKVVIEVAK